MGQSTSTQRPQTTPTNTTSRNNSPPIDTSRISEPVIQRYEDDTPVRSDTLFPQRRADLPEPDSVKRSRRSTLRRSIRNLLPSSASSSSTSSRRDSVASQAESSQSLKKKWRSSRRWSRAPERAVDGPGDDVAGHIDLADGDEGVLREERQQETTAATATEATPSTDTRTQANRPSPPSVMPLPRMPEQESSSARVDRIEEEIRSFLEGDSSSPVAGSSREVPKQQHETAEHATSDSEAPAEQDPREPDVRRPDFVEDNSNNVPATAESDQSGQTGPTGFPNTLVVVQGVVNAQDADPPTSQASAPSHTSRTSSRLVPTSPMSSVRRRASSTSRIGSRSNLSTDDRASRRNRLSTFMRPRSMLGQVPPDDVSHAQSSSTTLSDAPPEHLSTSQTSATPTPENLAETNELATPTDADARAAPRGLSPGSIDVLGTLLSVAATATAASLLQPTASSAAPQSLSSPPPPPMATTRPLSPTPTSGLGALGGLGGLGLGPSPSSSTVPTSPDRTDRIRNVWDSFRERVGFNHRNSSGTPERQPEGLTSAQAARIASRARDREPEGRPGEAMLAEMARALNQGLGLSPPPRATEPGPDGYSSINARISTPLVLSDPSQPPPPEGSFQRFLLNLQTDLRVLLSDDSASTTAGSTPLSAGSGTASSEDTTSDAEADDVDGSHSRVPTDASAESAAAPREGELEPESEEEPQSNVDDESQPDEDFVDAEESIEDETIHASTAAARAPTPIPSSSPSGLFFNPGQRRGNSTERADPAASAPATPAHNATRARDDRRPAINLWRLYRFPPIPASQAQENASRNRAQAAGATTVPATPAPPSPVTPVSTTPSIPVPIPAQASVPAPNTGEANPSEAAQSSTLPDVTVTNDDGDAEEAHTAEPAAADGASTEPNTPTDAPASEGSSAGGGQSFVIPVIVVGLQSMDVPLGVDFDGEDPLQPHVHADHQHEAGPSRPTMDAPAPRDVPVPSAAAMAGSGLGAGSATGTTRGWGTRAANALRSLRPNGRRSSRSRRNVDGVGSRTFLIYVIGGYYPPGHHMVTGSDRLDSYEALWELAELLGQVKPPTATKEDIEKSGLQVIPASELKKYEEQGKVSSNCVDRCLVCLDDYEPEDELRVMTCRHAFHKDCVDKWMQVGRNNCPACRSTGVNATNEMSPPSSSQSSPSPLQPPAPPSATEAQS